MSPDSVGVAVAGLGQAGRTLIGPLTRHPRCKLIAVADPAEAPRRAAAERLGVTTVATFHDLLSLEAVDAVYVATPTEYHAGHALAALAAGKHVILEKPMAASMEDAIRVVEAAEQARRVLLVGHSQSYEPAVTAIGALARAGDFGALQMVHNWCFTDWLYRPRLPAELDPARGGGVLFRQGAHQVDILRWVAGGMATGVRASLSPPGGRGTSPAHVLFIDFAGGVSATAVYSGADHLSSTEFTFGIGENGLSQAGQEYAGARKSFLAPGAEEARKRTLAFGGGGPDVSGAGGFFGLTVASFENADVRQVPGGLRIYGDRDITEVPLDGDRGGRDAMLDEFAEAVLDGKPAAHDGRWGRANLEVCFAALESTRSRREVELRFQVPVRTAG